MQKMIMTENFGRWMGSKGLNFETDWGVLHGLFWGQSEHGEPWDYHPSGCPEAWSNPCNQNWEYPGEGSETSHCQCFISNFVSWGLIFIFECISGDSIRLEAAEHVMMILARFLHVDFMLHLHQALWLGSMSQPFHMQFQCALALNERHRHHPYESSLQNNTRGNRFLIIF